MPATEEVQAIEELMESQELILAQLEKSNSWARGSCQSDVDGTFCWRTLPIRRRPRTRQNPYDSDFGAHSELEIQANPVHPGPDACRHHWHRCA